MNRDHWTGVAMGLVLLAFVTAYTVLHAPHDPSPEPVQPAHTDAKTPEAPYREVYHAILDNATVQPEDPTPYRLFDPSVPYRKQQVSAARFGLPVRETIDLGDGVRIALRLVPPGSFVMGGDAQRQNRQDEKPRREITINRAFYMGVFEITQRQYSHVSNCNPSDFKDPENPVESITWHDAAGFCTLVSRRTGRRVRLPTEAEWEYACRAGTTTRFSTGKIIDTDRANYNGRYIHEPGNRGANRQTTTVVGSFYPNPWGMYDMHGNVWEWCTDWYRDSYAGLPRINPRGPSRGTWRVLRGGSWLQCARFMESSYRSCEAPAARGSYIGFRIVVEIEPTSTQTP